MDGGTLSPTAFDHSVGSRNGMISRLLNDYRVVVVSNDQDQDKTADAKKSDESEPSQKSVKAKILSPGVQSKPIPDSSLAEITNAETSIKYDTSLKHINSS